MRLTMFTFGYWGWGNATQQLVRSIDAVERRRGFRPPMFVDIRIHRSVRAAGFRDDAFQRLLGPSRYKWMRRLGNRAVVGRSGGRRVLIDDPKAAIELLDLARGLQQDRRRAIFFCSCENPGHCHRATVAQLLLRAASRRADSLDVVEWPGGEPIARPLILPLADSHSSARLHVSSSQQLAELAALPYGTLVQVGPRVVPVGPVRYAARRWYLPILKNDDSASSVDGTLRAVMVWRRRYGYARRSA
jgi:hypothetical protein